MFLEHRVERFDPAVAREGAPSGEHLEQHAPERKDVGARVGVLTAGLFRRHVACRPEHQAGFGLCPCRLVSNLSRRFGGQSEIEELHLPVAGDEDVLGFRSR